MLPLISLGPVQFPTYLLLISFIFTGSLFWILRRAEQRSYSGTMALDLCMAVMIGSLIGARLAHVFIEEPAFYLAQPLEIFRIWNGGFVFYGGFLGGLSVGAYWLRRKDMPLLPWLDLFAPVLAFGYALGRIACFLNGCCYGRLCDWPWGVHFAAHKALEIPLIARHPTQIYASLMELISFGLLIWIESKNQTNAVSKVADWFSKPGRKFFLFLALHGLWRMIMESFREDFRGPELLSLSVSSWISLGLIAAALLFFKSSLKKS